jgi:hypothetical protein
MSSKSRKVKLPKTTAVPRQLDQINAEWTQRCNEAGQVQYQLLVLQEQLKRLNAVLASLNQEGAARNELSKQAKGESNERP